MATFDVLTEVWEERRRQDEKWGEQNHHPFVWMSILGEEFGEVCQEVLRGEFGDKPPFEYRQELVQVAAVAIAAVESLDRQLSGS